MKKLNKDQKIGAKYVLSWVRSILTRQLMDIDKSKKMYKKDKEYVDRMSQSQYDLDCIRDDLKEIAEKIGV
jgi:hypothetical protein